VKLRSLLFVVLLAAAIIPTLLFEAVPHSGAYEKELADVSERHLLIARNIGLALTRYDHDVKAAFKTLVSNMVEGNRLTDTQELLTGLNFRHICIASTMDSTIKFAINEEVAPCPERVPEARFKYFLEIGTTEKAVFSSVLPGPHGGPVLYLVWITGENLAVGAISTDYIVGLGKSVSFGKRGHAAIVDHKGKVLAHPLPNWRTEMKDLSKVSAVKRMLNKESGVETFYSPALKDDMIAGFTWVKGPDWGVMIPQPVSELKLRAKESQQHAIGGVFSGILLAALLSWLLAGYLIKPVVNVVETARKFIAGDQDARVPLSNSMLPRELADLINTINSLADAVGQGNLRLRTALVTAEHANKSKSIFLAHMSHELRTPLNAVIGFSSILANEMFGVHANVKYAEYSNDVLRSSEHLLEVINDILDISRIEAGEMDLEEENTDIAEQAGLCFRMVEERAKRKGVELVSRIENGLPPLRSDKRHIKQILLNLMANAVKFTMNGGIVTLVAGTQKDGGLSIQIIDTGVGIAPENIAKVLEPFGQIRDSQDLTHEGTGLGLTISRRLMELHDGMLSIESEVGKGTSVTLKFPPARTIRSI